MIVKYFIGPLKKYFVMTIRVSLGIDVILPAEFVALNLPVL